MPPDDPPKLTLRERKKREARKALAQAALRLTLDRGLENVKVEDIATEVGVSPRTFNNYFSSKEQAVCSVVVDRHEGMREALLARPDDEPLWDSVKHAVLEQYSREGEPDRAYVARIRELMGRLMLRGEFLNAHAAVERVLAETIAKRVGGVDHLLCRLMAASVESAVRVAFTNWFTTEGEPFLPILERLLDELSAGMPTLTAGATAPQPEPTTTPLGESLC
ncbi:TetR/AcrR family transcriptional regulator [Amycolatopsis eburnea]|uniref:TetR family transcriptional regulator n=1 Tax=Amycolatopsis eburnea TaxID=2267691 RepID=A0A427SXE8_9PSEU|nr:TetR/AcrR family transcriptional regulator [Amycolatopsis eburnea]RSD09304.1 TetR family transcriptional regulator [Amycolatopsis eburnea]